MANPYKTPLQAPPRISVFASHSTVYLEVCWMLIIHIFMTVINMSIVDSIIHKYLIKSDYVDFSNIKIDRLYFF